MEKTDKFNWHYVSVGGVVRVRIDSGEAIARLDELDQKKWTVLSCPVQGLEFDSKTLSLLDTDGDGKIRVTEVVSAAKWLTSVIKDKDLILKGDDVLPLGQIDTDNPDGKKLYDSAKIILKNLGLEKDEISIADTSDSVAIFSKTRFNGDGIITASTPEDDGLKTLVEVIGNCVGTQSDRSGEPGINAEGVEKFYAECADYSVWQADAKADAAVLPYGDNTAAALAAFDALKDKASDFFMRCKLIGFNEAVSGAVDVSVDKISAIADKNLSICADEIAAYPLARPQKSGILPFDAINPAWQAAFDKLKALVLDVEFKGKKGISEAEWNTILAKFGPYCAWMDAKKGAAVEPMGLEAVEAALKADRKAELLDLIAQDAALKDESEAIDEVDKLMHYYRDFIHLLNNYVVFSDFYDRNESKKAVFEAGSLYIDERCCNLCLKVYGNGNHAEAAGLSGIFLIYCTCTSRSLGKTQEIVAVMTDGGIKNLRPGKNAIFYDLDGNDWDAVVTKIVDNPISIRQAFWSPYRKVAAFINEKIEKNASEKDSSAVTDLMKTADTLGDKTEDKKQPFDIAKFAGIFAAIGMAFAGIGVALKSIVNGIVALKWWQLIAVIAGIMMIISGPACFLAWKKLRKRNLGPVLNANGWAINSSILINILFGKTLTSVAKYPIVKGIDPFKEKSSAGKWIFGILIALVVAAAVLYLTGNLECVCQLFGKNC